MTQTKAEVTTDAALSGLNPMGNTAVAGGQMVFIELNIQGVSPDLDGLVTAIETFYGADKVSGETDRTAHGILRLRVIA